MQGTYVLTTDGELLGRINSANPEHVLKMLDGALSKWRSLNRERPRATAPIITLPDHRWEDSYPSDGLALERFARDVNGPATDAPSRPVNQDAVWFAAGELPGFVPSSGNVGAVRDVAPGLIERLTRFAFVDNVRGQTLPFSSKAVRVAELKSEVTAVNEKVWTLRLWGRTTAETDGSDPGEAYWKSNRAWPRSLSTNIIGEARWDATRERFLSFELVAIGARKGRTTFNGRHREQNAAPHGIGFFLKIAPRDHRVAPTYINLYGAAWVKMPE